jgi:uroporphyrinogen III methyltransferase/synthase
MNSKQGKVYFIGAGPGDRGLITVKGKRALAKAEVVLYDSLVNASLLDICSPDAEKISVGKRAGEPSLTQEEINRLLLEKAQQGKLVVRLKGGDPFLFGRGGEEARILYKNNIPFQVIPGVTSALAVPAYAGIPVTDRRYASSVTFITGQEAPDKETSSLLWPELARGAETLVFLMGMRNLTMIVEQLLQHGRNPETPVAVIQRGTIGTQRVVTATLDTICEQVRHHAMKPPGIIVVGEVVTLRDELRWFEKLPLFGRRIAITREFNEEEPLAEILEDNGAEILLFPTIAFQPPDSNEDSDRMLMQMDAFHWIIFTSSNGVRFFMDRLFRLGRDVRALGNHRIAAIGSGTAATLKNYYIQADLVPEEFSAEGVVASFKDRGVTGVRILIPRAQEGRDVLETGLRALNNDVCVAPVYRTVVPERTDLTEKLDALRVADCVVFTSSSTVHNFFSILPQGFVQELHYMVLACIGPITANTLRKYGFAPHIIPESYDLPSLAEAIINYYSTLRSQGVRS